MIMRQYVFISLSIVMSLGNIVCEHNYHEPVHRAPYFISEPENAVFDIAAESIGIEEVSLRCQAASYPYPSYQWFRQEYVAGRLVAKLVDPLVNPRITISDGTLHIYKPDQIEDRGTYYCEASNRYGVIVSQTAQLTFSYMGHFNLKRSAEKGLEFWGKAIYCDPPQHFPVALYYWVRDSMPNFVEENERIFVSRDGNLYFTSLELIDNGKYSCLIQSSVSALGRTGPFFHLNVQPHSSSQQLQFPMNFPKVFPEAPIAGQDVYLECLVFGYPVPNYKWSRKGKSTQLPKNATLANFDRVLMLPEVNVEDSGDYVCTANNGKVSVSAMVTLNVQAKPIFITPLEDVAMFEGADLEWKCEAFGIPEVEYKWLRNGQELELMMNEEDAPRYVIRENLLLIWTLNPNRDQGVYQCKATNHIGSSYSSGEIRILSLPPSFAKHPLEVETLAAEGGNVNFTCVPEGSPKPEITWQFNGDYLKDDGRRFFIDPDGSLEIRKIRNKDEGLYTCIATNRYGTAKSEGRLKVTAAVEFALSLPPAYVAQLDDIVELNCGAKWPPGIDSSYAWFVNGIRAEDYVHRRFYPEREPGALLMFDMNFHDFGNVECRAVTPVHAVSSFTRLTVEGPPGQPGGLQVWLVSERDVQLQWMDGSENGSPITAFDVETRTGWNLTWIPIFEDVVPDVDANFGFRLLLINGTLLSPWSQHEFRVTARNKHGSGIPSAPSPVISTTPDRPYKYPSNIGGGGGNVGDLTITWTPLPDQDRNAPGIFYRLFYKLAKQNKWYYRQVDLNGIDHAGFKVVRVGDENYFKEYSVKVQAINTEGEGPVSPEVIIYSAEARPSVVPAQVSAWPLNSTALNVSWGPFEMSRENIRGKLTGFRIKYWRYGIDEPSYEATYYLSREIQNWAVIVGLNFNTEYAVVVSAFNGAGSGTESELFIMRTFKSAPLMPPTSVKVTPLSPSRISVSWRASAPSQEEAPLLGFKVRYWVASQDFSTYEDTTVSLRGSLIAEVKGLTPGVKYKLRVLAYSEGGDGRMSSPPWEFQLGDVETLRGCGPSHWRNNQSSWMSMMALAITLELSILH